MAIRQITDHATLARARLATQFRGTVSHGAVLDAVSRQVQQIEEAFTDLLTLVVISGSSGMQLDNLGRILGRERAGTTDVAYRAFLRAQILLNRSSGTVPEILGILGLVLSAYNGNAIEGRAYQPAALLMRIRNAIGTLDPTILATLLQRARVAGVRGLLEWASFADGEGFRCSSAWTAAHSTTLNAGIAAGVSSFNTAVLPGSWGSVPLWAYIDRGEDVAEVVKVTNVATTLSQGTFTLARPTVFAHSNGAAVELAPLQGFGTGKLAGVKEA